MLPWLLLSLALAGDSSTADSELKAELHGDVKTFVVAAFPFKWIALFPLGRTGNSGDAGPAASVVTPPWETSFSGSLPSKSQRATNDGSAAITGIAVRKRTPIIVEK